MRSKSNQIVNLLMHKRWERFDDVISDFADGKKVGIYVLAFTTKKLGGCEIQFSDVFYVGKSTPAKGLISRLKQFKSAANGSLHLHSGGERFYKEVLGGVLYSALKSRRKLYAAFICVDCNVSKQSRTAEDLRTMGEIVKAEFEVLARVKEATGREPLLNKQ